MRCEPSAHLQANSGEISMTESGNKPAARCTPVHPGAILRAPSLYLNLNGPYWYAVTPHTSYMVCHVVET